MDDKMKELILAWHDIYLSLNNCIESARVVLDQSDRGTLLPDRVREMRGELLATQERLPKLVDLMEEFTGETVWPVKPEDAEAEGLNGSQEPTEEEEAAETPAGDTEPPATAEGDYTADGSTPGAHEVVDEEAAAEPGEEGHEGASTEQVESDA